MSSSGLIYAVIVGAWAAYLVPMWLRRQDELNEARPTERFSTAIRLLSGRAGMERRYAKDLEHDPEQQDPAQDPAQDPRGGPAPASRDSAQSLCDTDRRYPMGPMDAVNPMDAADAVDPVDAAVDVRAFAAPLTSTAHQALPPEDLAAASVPAQARPRPPGAEPAGRPGRPLPTAVARIQRAKVLARRRRTTMVLFLAFSAGAVAAGVGGKAFLWAPAVPAGLLSAYIAHLRVQERRRFAVTMDRRRAESAARQLRERTRRAEVPAGGDPAPEPVRPERRRPAAPAAAPARPSARTAADRQALVEQTDHAEWVDQQREGRLGRPDGDGWEPTPVPLPTYVSAPVAPRTARGVDLGAPDAWSSARSGPADRPPVPAPEPSRPAHPERRSRNSRTPLFDQYAGDDRPRAANE